MIYYSAIEFSYKASKLSFRIHKFLIFFKDIFLNKIFKECWLFKNVLYVYLYITWNTSLPTSYTNNFHQSSLYLTLFDTTFLFCNYLPDEITARGITKCLYANMFFKILLVLNISLQLVHLSLNFNAAYFIINRYACCVMFEYVIRCA